MTPAGGYTSVLSDRFSLLRDILDSSQVCHFKLTKWSDYDRIYLLTAIGLTPGGSSTVHIYTQTIHRTKQLTTNWAECGPCPVFKIYTLAFALQLRKKHGKTSVWVAEECQLAQ